MLRLAPRRVRALVLANTRPEHLAALAVHQRICYPTLAEYELMNEEHFASHLRLFPPSGVGYPIEDEQHVALRARRRGP